MADDFKNDVCFSASRESLLAECARQYYYNVYGSWDGWWMRDRKPEPRRAEAYEAKHATTEVFLAGKIVHRRAEWAVIQAKRDKDFLRRFGGREGVRDHMQSMARQQIDEALAQARSKVRGSPKKWVQLVSVNNGESANEEWLRERVHTRIEALCAEDASWDNGGERPRINLLMRAISAVDRVVHCEELIEWRVGTPFGDIKSFLAHDLVVRSPRDPSACTIVDWKTGKEYDENGDQLDFYAAWASNNGWQHVDTALVYLGDGSTVVRWATPDLNESVSRTSRRVFEFVDTLREKLVGKDLSTNVAVESKFEPTKNPGVCRSCRFAKMCERDGTKPS